LTVPSERPYIFYVGEGKPKRSFAVSILNQRLTVRSDADEGYVKEVASFVNERIQEAIERNKTASTLTAALLACLNIADELFRGRRMKEARSVRAAQKVRDLIGLIATHLNGGAQAL
jgi:cell division protein ZapA